MADRFINVGDMDSDYIDSSGNITKNDDVKMVMVRTAADKSLLTDYRPGTIAYTAGFKNIWQLDASGSWQTIIEEGNG